jgi:hypothetical protein
MFNTRGCRHETTAAAASMFNVHVRLLLLQRTVQRLHQAAADFVQHHRL